MNGRAASRAARLGGGNDLLRCTQCFSHRRMGSATARGSSLFGEHEQNDPFCHAEKPHVRVVDQVLEVSQPSRTGGKFVTGDLDICVLEVVLEVLTILNRVLV